MILVHVMAGMLALPAGAIAMTARKGSTLHRRAGITFVAAMLVMSSLGTVLAALRPSLISVVAGALTFYLVSTALLTMRRTVRESRKWITGFMLMALMVAAYGFYYGVVAARSPNGNLQGVPAAVYFAFASFALAGAFFDARLLRAGEIQGAPRLARHLGRMGLAMFIASASLFLGQARVFPKPVRNFALLSIPVIVVLVHLLYWLVRVRINPRPRMALS